MTHAYHPATGEIILTDSPAPWMGATDAEPPAFDPATQSAFWRDGQWEVVTIEPEAPHIPAVVSMRKARLALLGAGLLSQVNDAVAAMPGIEGEAARIEWEYAQEVSRVSPLVAGLSVSLGLSDADLDALFLAADGL